MLQRCLLFSAIITKQAQKCFASSSTRGNFGYLQDSDLTKFEKICGTNNVKTSELNKFNIDWMGQFKGNSKCVLLPESNEQISQILKHCYSRRLAISPQSGNTGLVGGSIPVHDEIILSLRKINKMFKLDNASGILECDAGFILEEIDQKLAPHGFMVPLDLGAKGSCLIGGNISTCAGGVRLLRYGSMHANVLGLTVVLPDENGTILKMGNGLRKDNTSLHSHHLFIGAEGQLGIITQCQISVAPRPTSVHSAFLGIKSFQKVTDVLRKAKKELSEILSSFELLDLETLKCLEENEGLKSVLPNATPFAILIETSGSSVEHDAEKFSGFLESVLSDGLAVDGVLAESASESAQFWKLRETAPLAVMKDGYVYKNDISLPLKHFYEITEILRCRLNGKVIRVTNYGHIGDGNAHVNITSKKFDSEVYQMIYPFLYEWVADHGGSISAEHGIGQLKRPYLHLGKTPEELHLDQRLKQIFDPRGILSPYKMIDSL